MKPMPEPSTNPAGGAPHAKRRGILLGAGAAAAAGAVVVVASRSGVEPAAPPAERQARADESGYRLTEHVRRYYETART